MNNSFKNLLGFSLIELSIVVLVMSVIISGTFIFVGDASFQAKLIDDEERINLIDEKINEFYIKNGYLPCPASRSEALNSANFGDETDCSLISAPTGTTHAAINQVRIGTIPVRALGLPDKFMFDAYNNRYTYAVNRVHAIDSATFTSTYTSSTPVININHVDISTSTQTNITNFNNNDNVMYVLVGHGPNGNGATSYSGTLQTCSTSFNDAENCDLDENFVDIYKVPDRFDDNIRWGTKQNLIYTRLKETKQLGKSNLTQGKFGLFSYRTTDGGSNLGVTSPPYNVVPLNYVYTNNLSDAVLDTTNNRVLLGAGHYIIRAYNTACAVNNTQLQLYTTTNFTLIPGISTYADTTNNDCTSNYAVGYLNLQEPEGISVYLYTGTSNFTDGVGRNPGTGFGYSLNYVFLEIWEL